MTLNTLHCSYLFGLLSPTTDDPLLLQIRPLSWQKICMLFLSVGIGFKGDRPFFVDDLVFIERLLIGQVGFYSNHLELPHNFHDFDLRQSVSPFRAWLNGLLRT
jgi:hypothetical protein